MARKSYSEEQTVKAPLTKLDGSVITERISIKEAERRLMNARNTIWAMQEKAQITRKEREEISNLLAVIHRDGGHYESKHGLLKAVEDAERKVVAWLAELQLRF